MKKILSILNGNKTIICLTLATVLQKAIEFDIINNSNYMQFTLNLLLLLGSGSLLHHAKKGYFKQNKGF